MSRPHHIGRWPVVAGPITGVDGEYNVGDRCCFFRFGYNPRPQRATILAIVRIGTHLCARVRTKYGPPRLAEARAISSWR